MITRIDYKVICDRTNNSEVNNKTMTKPKIYVFSGFSGAGKDTAASVIDAQNVKFSSPGKRTLEFIYQLPVGFMDDRVAREMIAPHSGGKTYLEILVNFWDHRNLLIGDTLYGEQSRVEILDILEGGQNVAITDMRNHNELYILADMCELGYEVIPVWIEGGESLRSDVLQLGLYRQICAFAGSLGLTIANDSPTAEDFKAKVLDELIWFYPYKA